jgi:biotin carboxylase
MTRILILLPTKTYRSKDFLAAAARLGLEVTVASEEPSALEQLAPDALITLDIHDAHGAAEEAVRFASRHRVDGVIGVDEDTAYVAAVIGKQLALPGNSVASTYAARNKLRMREVLQAARVPVPRFWAASLDEEPEFLDHLSYPRVLKPLILSGSRGVMRADDPADAKAKFRRLRAIMDAPDVVARDDALSRLVLAEEFVAGPELALEGLVTNGQLRTLALFAKPDPLDGPFFAETIYVTPSGLDDGRRRRVEDTVGAAARALGLHHGPVHAEVRLTSRGVYPLEVAARTIGGLCSRSLSFRDGASLEEIVLRHALGMEVPSLEREAAASGVYMIPVPRRGVLAEIGGADEATGAHPGVTVTITAHVGQDLVPLPEESVYLGFVFARAETPEEVVAILRDSVARIRFTIEPKG